jgi:hypothetical protein
MASNPAIASRLQSDALVRRVAELGSLIWLNFCQAGSKILFRFFHGFASDLAQWTDGLARAA